MTFATYPYSDAIREMFASMGKLDRTTELARARGERVDADIYRTWLGKSEYTKEHIEKKIDELCKDIEFQKLVLARHKRELNCDVSWNYYIENAVLNLVEFVHKDYRSWQCLFLSYVYNWYKNDRKQKFPTYYPNNPLELYYRSKGIELNMSSNYGLVDTCGFEIKYLNGPMLYDKLLDTHIYIKFIPPKLLAFIAEVRKSTPFKLSLRPDYEICGDGMVERMQMNEGVGKGAIEPIALDKMPPLTFLYDDTTCQDRLIVLHNRETSEIIFEEVLADPQIDEDTIVTQVVHMRYAMFDNKIFIAHLDHEYVFYTAEQHTEKMDKLDCKGEARKKYKTFKIDKAQIEYRTTCAENIVYQALDSYFTNKELLTEYFKKIIN